MAVGSDYVLAVWRNVARQLGHRLRVLTGRSAGRLVLVLPLMLAGRRLRFLSCEKFEYRDALVEDTWAAADWMAQAVAFAIRRLRVRTLDLRDVPAEGLLADALADVLPHGVVSSSESPVIRLDRFADWDDYARSLPPALMADQRRQWRRVARLDQPWAFRLAAPDELDGLIDWLFTHKLRWAAARGIDPGIMATDGYRRHVGAVVADAMARGTLIFGRLGSAGQTASVGFGTLERERFVFAMFGYDEAFATYSPSRLLQERMIRCCQERGVATFDFLPGKEAYKRVWANDAERVLDMLVPLTALARARLAWSRRVVPWLRRQPVLQRTYQQLPAGLRSGVRRALRADWDRLCAMDPQLAGGA